MKSRIFSLSFTDAETKADNNLKNKNAVDTFVCSVHLEVSDTPRKIILSLVIILCHTQVQVKVETK